MSDDLNTPHNYISPTTDASNQVARTTDIVSIAGVADAWNNYARQLAAWATKHLINRSDIWGGYRPLKSRGTPYLDSTGMPILGKNGTPKLRGTVYTANTKEYHNPDKHFGLDDLTRHFAGLDHGDIRGLHTTSPQGTCLWGVIEISTATKLAPTP